MLRRLLHSRDNMQDPGGVVRQFSGPGKSPVDLNARMNRFSSGLVLSGLPKADPASGAL